MVDLLQIIDNLVAAISPGGGGLTTLFYVMSWIIGLVICIQSLLAAGKRDERGPQGGSIAAPFSTFMIGALFIAMPGLMTSLTQTIFGVDSSQPSDIFSYAPATVGLFEETGQGGRMIVGLITIIQFLGMIAIMRGLLILRATALGGQGGQKTFGAGVVHVIAGCCATNYPLFMQVIESLVATS